MNTKHTPGPWAADKLLDRSAFNIFMPGYCSAGASVHHCSNSSTCMGGLEVEANARLIAAAPDLLERLEELLEYSDHLRGSAVYNRAHAAIARATGA